MSDGETNCGRGNNYGSHTWSGGTIGDAVFGLVGPLAAWATYGVICHGISLLLVVVWSYKTTIGPDDYQEQAYTVTCHTVLNCNSLSKNPPCQHLLIQAFVNP